MMRKHVLLFCLMLTSSLAYANPVTCKPLPDAAKNFSLKDYQACMTYINQCPKTGAFFDNNCVNNIAASQPVCQSSTAIATAINMPLGAVSFIPAGPYNIVTATYAADGQSQDYILSPRACLVDTVIDPRQLDNKLSKQYANKDFLVVNIQPPTIKQHADGTTSFMVLLRVTDTCLACAVLGWANVSYDFDTQGNLTGTVLQSFSPEPLLGSVDAEPR